MDTYLSNTKRVDMDMTVQHPQQLALALLSRVGGHVLAWFGLVDGRMFTQGCSPWPPPSYLEAHI
jgi:hypothetical protein